MALQTCFALDGTILTDFGSCSDQVGDNVCCAAGQTCMSNGLCATEKGDFYNGGCTDQSYKSSNCPRFCTSGTNRFIVACKGSGISTGGSPTTKGFCCSGDGSLDCCSDTRSLLPLATATSSAQAAFVISVTPSSAASGFTFASGMHSILSSLTSSPAWEGSNSTLLPTPDTPDFTTFQILGPSSRPSPGNVPENNHGRIDKAASSVPTILFILLVAYLLYRVFRRRRATVAVPMPSEVDAGVELNTGRGELEAQSAAIAELEDTSPTSRVVHAQTSHDGAGDERGPDTHPSPPLSPRSVPDSARNIPRPPHPSPETALLGPRRTRRRAWQLYAAENEGFFNLPTRSMNRSPTRFSYGTMEGEGNRLSSEERPPLQPIEEDQPMALHGQSPLPDQNGTPASIDSSSEENVGAAAVGGTSMLETNTPPDTSSEESGGSQGVTPVPDYAEIDDYFGLVSTSQWGE